jgi:hypothetical protein
VGVCGLLWASVGLCGSLWPLGDSGSLREAFSKVLAFVSESPIPIRRNCRFKYFLGFCGGDPIRGANLEQFRISDDFDRFNAFNELLVSF